MFEELKKKSCKKSIAGTILTFIVGIALLVVSASSVFYAVTGYVDFEKLEPDEIKNQTVTFEMTTNFGCYMEEYEYNSDTGYSRTTDLYYIIWTGDENATEFCYMTVKVPASFEAEMEAMAENTFNNYLSDPITINGKIRKLDDEEYGYFEEFFLESEWTPEEIAEGTLPYYIDYYGSPNGTNALYIIIFLAGIFFVAWGILRIVKAATGGFLKKLNKDIADAGYTESAVASDYDHATSMTKKDTLKIGRLMIYYEVGSVVRAIPTAKMMWAYMNKVTHRYNGIKTGTTYSVVIVVEGVSKAFEITVPKEAVALEVLEKINTMFPWVVVGYTDQLKKLLKDDRAQFLSLRYNTCEHVAVEPGFENFNGYDSAAQ